MDNMVVIKLIIILTVAGSAWFRTHGMSQVDPPAVFVMDWSNLSQQIVKGSSNFGVDIKPILSGTIEMSVRAPTCVNRFNGLRFTRHVAGGFLFFAPATNALTGSYKLSI